MTTAQIFRIYALEGLVMTVIAVIVAPFLAVAGVALGGCCSRSSAKWTDGNFLPLVVGPIPFLVAAVTGLACLVVYAVPAAVGSRGGLLLHKLRSARPPSIPFVHRYYLDIGILGHRRNHLLGNCTTGGKYYRAVLFRKRRGQRGAPFWRLSIFLLVVGAPLPQGSSRSWCGLSPASPPTLSHILLALAVVPLAVGDTVTGISGRTPFSGRVGSARLFILALVVAAYLFTTRSVLIRYRIVGYAAQVGLIYWFSLGRGRYASPESPHGADRSTHGKSCPVQLAFAFFRIASRFLPAPVSIGTAVCITQTPLQYSWARTSVGHDNRCRSPGPTTVGGTLERGQTDQAQYDAGGRTCASLCETMSTCPSFPSRPLLERYETNPRRTGGLTGLPRARGLEDRDGVEVFAVDSREFPFLAW